ncbi:MAG: hypothetical protein R3C24_13605 [Cyanobacteriota/Melainabacteria group bacterium]
MIAAFVAALSEPFGSLSLSVLLLSGLVQGVFAGWFLNAYRLWRFGIVGNAHENNGFIVGLCSAGALLFFSISSPDLLALGSGVLAGAGGSSGEEGFEKP